jgi:hypothetical protein
MVAEVEALLASAWTPPTVADEAAALKADAEARRFLTAWDRLSCHFCKKRDEASIKLR